MVVEGGHPLPPLSRQMQYYALAAWWDAHREASSNAERDLGDHLRLYVKEQGRKFVIARDNVNRIARAWLCVAFVVGLLATMCAVAGRAFYFEQGMELYTVEDVEDPQATCLCDDRCRCTCSNFTFLTTDLKSMIDCQYKVEQVCHISAMVQQVLRLRST